MKGCILTISLYELFRVYSLNMNDDIAIPVSRIQFAPYTMPFMYITFHDTRILSHFIALKYVLIVLHFISNLLVELQARGDHHRNVCIIPVSAHGTNPASAAMCGMKIVTIGTDAKGNINIEELRKAAEVNKDNLSAFMVYK